MSKVDTVNVIEYADDSVSGVVSFTETPEGNKEAEAWFTKLVKEDDDKATNDEMIVFLDDGWYEAGTYQIFLTHSS